MSEILAKVTKNVIAICVIGGGIFFARASSFFSPGFLLLATLALHHVHQETSHDDTAGSSMMKQAPCGELSLTLTKPL